MEELLKKLEKEFPNEIMEIKTNQAGVQQIIINDKIQVNNVQNVLDVSHQFHDNNMDDGIYEMVFDFVNKELEKNKK